MDIDQSRQDELLTATLPAWQWRSVMYCVETMWENRASFGYDTVAEHYQQVRDSLASSLGVESSGGLPTKDGK